MSKAGKMICNNHSISVSTTFFQSHAVYRDHLKWGCCLHGNPRCFLLWNRFLISHATTSFLYMVLDACSHPWPIKALLSEVQHLFHTKISKLRMEFHLSSLVEVIVKTNCWNLVIFLHNTPSLRNKCRKSLINNFEPGLYSPLSFLDGRDPSMKA